MTITRALYDTKADKAGKSEGLLVGDEWRLWGRLAMMTKLLSDHGLLEKPVLDLGCGYGDLRRLMPNTPYLGVEGTQWIVDYAKANDAPVMYGLVEGGPYMYGLDRECRHAVVAGGLLGTVPRDHFGAFMMSLASWAPQYLLVTWMDSGQYTGRFHAYCLEDVQEALPNFEMVDKLASVPGDSINDGALFVRKA